MRLARTHAPPPGEGGPGAARVRPRRGRDAREAVRPGEKRGRPHRQELRQRTHRAARHHVCRRCEGARLPAGGIGGAAAARGAVPRVHRVDRRARRARPDQLWPPDHLAARDERDGPDRADGLGAAGGMRAARRGPSAARPARARVEPGAADAPQQLDLGFDARRADARGPWTRPSTSYARRFGNTCIQRGAELLDETLLGLDVKRDNVVHPVGYF